MQTTAPFYPQGNVYHQVNQYLHTASRLELSNTNDALITKEVNADVPPNNHQQIQGFTLYLRLTLSYTYNMSNYTIQEVSDQFFANKLARGPRFSRTITMQ